jgi:hypothetical protein
MWRCEPFEGVLELGSRGGGVEGWRGGGVEGFRGEGVEGFRGEGAGFGMVSRGWNAVPLRRASIEELGAGLCDGPSLMEQS